MSCTVTVHPIRTARDLKAALVRIETLWGAKSGTSKGDELDVLTDLVDSYGQRTVLAADGVTARAASLYGQQIGFTGRYEDKESKLLYFRARYYSGSLGRFVSRDPMSENVTGSLANGGYVDGYGLYGAYYIPNAMDPFGLWWLGIDFGWIVDTVSEIDFWRKAYSRIRG